MLPGFGGKGEDTRIVSTSVGRMMLLWREQILEWRQAAELRGGSTISDSILEEETICTRPGNLGGGYG